MLLFICSIIFLFCVSSVVASDVDDYLSLDEADSFEVDDMSISSDDNLEESQDSDYLGDVASDSDGSDKNQLQTSEEENNDLIIVVPDTIIDRDVDVLSLKMPKTASGVLSVQIGKYDKENLNWVVDKEIPLENGTAIYSFKRMEFGKYNVTAKYVGDDFIVPEFSNNITVNPEVSFPTKMIRGDDQFVTVNIPGAEGYMEYFEFIIDELFAEEILCEVTLKNGVGRIPLKQLEPGFREFPFSIYLKGDNPLDTYFQYNVWINVEKPILKPVSTSVYCTSNYKVQITGIDKDLIVVGDKVTFKIGNKIIGTGKIDKNGYASIKLNLKPGSYKISTVYKKESLSKKVTVKHIVNLKAVKVKKSAKKLVLQATVKVGKKAITKKKVTFKFNGKKYTAKTNKKGVAKVTISKKILKKLKVGKKVKYQATYLKDTVKKTAKVKW